MHAAKQRLLDADRPVPSARGWLCRMACTDASRLTCIECLQTDLRVLLADSLNEFRCALFSLFVIISTIISLDWLLKVRATLIATASFLAVSPKNNGQRLRNETGETKRISGPQIFVG